MTEQDLLDIGFTKAKIFHLDCYTKGKCTIWYNNGNGLPGFYCELKNGETRTNLSVEKVKELIELLND